MIKKFFTKINSSLYSLLLFYISIILIISIFILTFSIIFELNILNDSQKILEVNTSLITFYNECESMDSTARNFLYSSNHLDFEIYLNHKKNAILSLNNISQKIPKSTKRFSYLNNMIENYHSSLLSINSKKNSKNIYLMSEQLKYNNQLIQKTSNFYNNYLNNSFQEEIVSLKRYWKNSAMVSCLILFLLTFIIFLSGIKFFKKVVNPIKKMIQNINNISKGIYEIDQSNSEIEEYKILSNSIIMLSQDVKEKFHMIEHEEKLKRKVLEQTNENLKIKNLLSESEIKMLQLQISPHFLFNTLSMISQYAYLDGKSEITELMNKLSSVLRYTIKKTNKLSNLSDEIIYIQDYMYIQKKRFKDKLNFTLRIDKNIPSINLPALTIQPIIENSIKHGIKDITNTGEIILKAYINAINSKKYLQLEVEDNGVGMNSKSLEDIYSNLDKAKNSPLDLNYNHIGIVNVYKRLYMYLGKDFIFNIASEEDCGTIVSIMIPME